jgi:hypothetical protein
MAEITDVLLKLKERTTQGKVAWRATPESQTSVATIGSNSGQTMAELLPIAVLSILNASGDEIEKFQAAVSDDDYWKAVVLDLQRAASRVALGVDETLDALGKVE